MSFDVHVVTAPEWGAVRKGPFQRTLPKFIVVHHTANSNPPNDPSHGTLEGARAFARSIQADHFRRGFSDSGHNFLNTTGGFVLEGRHGSLVAVEQGFCVKSAHARQDPHKLAGGNDSPGIENEGNFMQHDVQSPQWDRLVELCAALCRSCHLSPESIRGHREFSDTDCPGDRLFVRLPQLRAEVAAKLGVLMDEDTLANRASGVLRHGAEGEDVKALQTRLQALGFAPGAIDGIFGDHTRAAVIAFQRSRGLDDDGVVGPITREALGL